MKILIVGGEAAGHESKFFLHLVQALIDNGCEVTHEKVEEAFRGEAFELVTVDEWSIDTLINIPGCKSNKPYWRQKERW